MDSLGAQNIGLDSSCCHTTQQLGVTVAYKLKRLLMQVTTPPMRS